MKARTGSGLLAVVALLIAILLMLGLSRAFLSDSVLDDAAAEQLGATALNLAESALEELQLAVRAGVNDPASPLHAQFRARLPGSTDPGFALPALAAPASAQLAAAAGVSLEIEPVRVTRRQLFENKDFNYNEHFGRLSYRVRATASRGLRKIARTLTAAQDYKVVFASIPPPFDQSGLFVVNAGPIMGGNATNRAAETFETVRRTWTGYLSDLLAATPGAAREIAALKAEFERIPTVFQNSDELWISLDTAFSAGAPSVAGESVDLASQLAGAQREVERLDERAAALVARVREAGETYRRTNQKPDPALFDAAFAAMRGVATRARVHQEAIRRWQDMMAEKSGAARRKLLTDVEHLTLPTLERKAYFRVSEADAGGDATAALDRLEARLRADTGTDALNGIVYVDNPRSVLDLTRRAPVRGRRVYVTSGSARVANLARATPTDGVSVICHGTLTVEGDVTGVLAAMGRLAIRGPVKLTGALVANTLAPGDLKGLTLVDDPTLRQGAKQAQGFVYDAKYLYVGVAPVIASRTIER